MYSVVTNLGLIAASKAASLAWLGLVSLLSVQVSGQALYKLDLNEKAGEGIYVVTFQVCKLCPVSVKVDSKVVKNVQGDGYARDNTLIKYLDNITAPLLSYTYCHRLQMFYTRPRMYISTYAFNNEESNELYSEYHLGRAAFR